MASKDYLHLDERSLITDAVNGDSRAFGEIVRRYEAMVARTVIGMIGNTQAAEDVGQDTFIRLYNSLGDFRGDAKLGTYIQRIAINLSLNELKKSKRIVSIFQGKDRDGKENVIPDPAYSEEESNDLKEVLAAAIKKLAPEYRSLVVLRLIQGYSTKEAAEILKLPLGTALSRLSRAREILQDEINKLNS